MSFIAPSPSLFSLLSPLPLQQPTPSQPFSHSTYKLLNSPSSTEQQIEDEIERIANGLFSAVVTTGLSPILSQSHALKACEQDTYLSSARRKEMRQKW